MIKSSASSQPERQIIKRQGFTPLESPSIYTGLVEIESISSLLRGAKPCPFKRGLLEVTQ